MSLSTVAHKVFSPITSAFALSPEDKANRVIQQERFESQPPETFANLKNYWPYYLSQHTKPATRALHFAGITGGAILLGAAALTNPWLALASPVLGLGMARLSHRFVEHNAPAKPPGIALKGDFYMVGQMLRGHLWTGNPLQDGEMERTRPR